MSSERGSVDTFNGLFYIPDKSRKTLYFAKDKDEIDILRAKVSQDKARMEAFWENLETKTNWTYKPSVGLSILKEKLRGCGCENNIKEFDEIHKDIKVSQKTLGIRASTASIARGRILGLPKAQQEAEIEVQISRSGKSAVSRKRKIRDVGVTEYDLEDRVLAILERYPPDSVKELIDMLTGKNSKLPDQLIKESKESVQADMLLLDAIIDRLGDGKRMCHWEVDIPDLDSGEYSHISSLRSDVFTTKTLTDAKKKELMEQAEEELIEELKPENTAAATRSRPYNK